MHVVGFKQPLKAEVVEIMLGGHFNATIANECKDRLQMTGCRFNCWVFRSCGASGWPSHLRTIVLYKAFHLIGHAAWIIKKITGALSMESVGLYCCL